MDPKPASASTELQWPRGYPRGRQDPRVWHQILVLVSWRPLPEPLERTLVRSWKKESPVGCSAETRALKHSGGFPEWPAPGAGMCCLNSSPVRRPCLSQARLPFCLFPGGLLLIPQGLTQQWSTWDMLCGRLQCRSYGEEMGLLEAKCNSERQVQGS